MSESRDCNRRYSDRSGNWDEDEEATAAAVSWSGAEFALLTGLPWPVEAGSHHRATPKKRTLRTTRIYPSAFAVGIMCSLPRPSRCFIADLSRCADPWPPRLSGKIAGSSEICRKIA